MDNLPKKLIILSLGLIIFALIWIYGIPYLNRKLSYATKENLVNVNMNLTDMHQIINKDVYITCAIPDKQGNDDIYHLAVADKKQCDNLKNVQKNECAFDIPVLQKYRNKFAKFRVFKHPTQNKYTLRSRMTELNSPHLSQNLNIYHGNINYLCFGNDTQEDVIYFETEENNAGILLKFKKVLPTHVTYYYVGLCNPLSTSCMQGQHNYQRLCLYADPKYALSFQFYDASHKEKECGPKESKHPKPVMIHTEHIHTEMIHKPTEETHKPKPRKSPQIEKFEDIESMYSLWTNGSNMTEATHDGSSSIPGLDMMDDNYETV